MAACRIAAAFKVHADKYTSLLERTKDNSLIMGDWEINLECLVIAVAFVLLLYTQLFVITDLTLQNIMKLPG